VDPQERIRELSYLIAALPLANYCLLRALTAHLILIVQNSNTNKMTMRNVGIVFSPTLGIPAGVFSLMLGEFNRVFNVDADNDDVGGQEDSNGSLLEQEPLRRNSRQYSDAAADQLLGLSGRSLSSALCWFSRFCILIYSFFVTFSTRGGNSIRLRRLFHSR
jgi:RalA-binding protein 1